MLLLRLHVLHLHLGPLIVLSKPLHKRCKSMNVWRLLPRRDTHLATRPAVSPPFTYGPRPTSLLALSFRPRAMCGSVWIRSTHRLVSRLPAFGGTCTSHVAFRVQQVGLKFHSGFPRRTICWVCLITKKKCKQMVLRFETRVTGARVSS